jgi:hypothetical protein
MDLLFEMGEIRGENGRGHQNLGMEHTRFQGSVFRVQRPAKLAFLKPEPGNLNPLGSFSLTIRGGVSCYGVSAGRYRAPQASTLDWNVRLND